MGAEPFVGCGKPGNLWRPILPTLLPFSHLKHPSVPASPELRWQEVGRNQKHSLSYRREKVLNVSMEEISKQRNTSKLQGSMYNMWNIANIL